MCVCACVCVCVGGGGGGVCVISTHHSKSVDDFLLLIIIDRFYIALFAIGPTNCPRVACDSE